MATRRSEVCIPRPADEVWKIVEDAGSIHRWFPLISTSTIEGERRTVVLQDGSRVDEVISVVPELRRFQYRIVGGDVPVESHLGTVDVHDLGAESLMVYSTEISPDPLAEVIGPRSR